jgi:alpha-1,2-mannosyltransferase
MRIRTRSITAIAIVAWSVAAGYMFWFAARWQLDLQVYRAAGHQLFAGGNPFDSLFTRSRLPFTYPPFALLVLSPFSIGSIGVVETLWWLLGAAALVTTTFVLLESDRRRAAPVLPAPEETAARKRSFAVAAAIGGIAALGLEPLRTNIDYGQVNFGLMLLVSLDATRRESRWRGSLIGLAAAIRLTPFIYLVLFLFRRDWKSFLRGIGVFVAATLVTWAVVPSESSLYWFHEAGNSGRTGGVSSRSNQSWYGLLHRPPFHGSFWAWVMLATLTVACGLFIASRSSRDNRISEAVMALALTELMVSPVSWSHHWSWLAIAPIVIVSLWGRRRIVAWAMIVLLVTAAAAPYWWFHPRGPLTDLTCDALVLCGAAVLVIWTISEFRAQAALQKGTRVDRGLIAISKQGSSRVPRTVTNPFTSQL